MKIAVAQINPTVGNLKGNTAKVLNMILKAREKEAELLIFPELALTGYPPRDLLLYKTFTDKVISIINGEILPVTGRINIILGAPWRDPGNYRLYNSALLISEGRIISLHHKTLLPNYDVFDESRYFTAAPDLIPAVINGKNIAVTVCEDIWNDKDYFERRIYPNDPVEELFNNGAEMLVNISASPYHLGKAEERADMLCALSRKYKTPVIYANQTGGNDELLFDGSSMIFSEKGELLCRAHPFEEDLIICDTDNQQSPGFIAKSEKFISPEEDMEWVFPALSMGLRDYLNKSGFSKVVLGLSGGIDSAVVAAIAVAALGKENVCGIMMPSRYSSGHSVEDSRELACNLGMEVRLITIEEPFCEFMKLMNKGKEAKLDLAEENLQARIRGDILMFISNREGRMVLPTGNKSELAVGYCTLYGDMCGGISVLADLPKVDVYRLADYINRKAGKTIIPESIIQKAPSAELRPGQTDQDSLPPYETLDSILKGYIEDNRHIDEIVALGFDREVVKDVVTKVDNSEYKRNQAAPGLRITTRAFGSGRRMPLAKGSFYQ